jgi:hypothetical protein
MGENIFSKNPISVNIININGFKKTKGKVYKHQIKQQIFWPTNDDSKVLDLWESKNVKNINKYYGRELIYSSSQSVQKGKKGGKDDDTNDTENTDELGMEDEMYEVDNNELGDEDENENSEDSDNDEISFNDADFEDVLSDKPLISNSYASDANSMIVDKLQKSQSSLTNLPNNSDNSSSAKELSFIVDTDIFIFPEDNISDFKKKIFIATGIPVYRQHLWYEFKGKAYPMNYKIIYNTALPIDIRSLYNHEKYFEGLPIDNYWYMIKDSLFIKAMDDFKLLEHNYYMFGVTEYFLVDLNDYIFPIRGNLEYLISKDMYSIKIIYYSFIMKYWPQLSLSAFGDYIKDVDILNERYPNLSPQLYEVRQKYKMETRIIKKIYNTKIKNMKGNPNPPTVSKSSNVKEKNMIVPINISITKCSLSIIDTFRINGSYVNLRNLFDVFELSESVKSMMCSVNINGRYITLTKLYKSEKAPNIKIQPDTAVLTIIIDITNILYIIINKDGNYKIESTWQDDKQVNFDNIYDYIDTLITPVIEYINTFDSTVLNSKLTTMNKTNTAFIDLDISLFWKYNATTKMFDKLRSELDKYESAGIIFKNTSDEASVANTYYYRKGMYKYNFRRYNAFTPLNNQYQYLLDQDVSYKYKKYILLKKKIKFVHRFSDIRIDISGINENEYSSIISSVNGLMDTIPLSKEKPNDEAQLSKKLKNLKEKDPNLYDLKKVYNSDIIYSKLCQKQKQPVIYNEPGKNRITFWNYTNNEVAYYGCPNPKYPYINFITSTHPKNYCLPCCYKIPPSTSKDDGKSIKYDSCINKREYTSVKKSVSKSRYIMTYGKQIEVGRISSLPETTLEPLFYNTYSVENTNVTDIECVKKEGWYVYGVSQNIKNVSYVGFVFCIAHVLGKNIIEFIKETISKLNKLNWYSILNNDIANYFNTFDDFIQEITDVFIGNKQSVFELWNDIFIDIVYIYWKITLINFIDLTTDVSIKINDISTYKLKNKTTDDIHVLIISKDRYFYPIYFIDTDSFFKTGSIIKKTYTIKDPVIVKLYDVVASHSGSQIKKSIDMSFIQSFVASVSNKYSATKYYINELNLCYGVHLINTETYINPSNSPKSPNASKASKASKVPNNTNNGDEQGFFIPIKNSTYINIIANKTITFEIPTESEYPTWPTLDAFMKSINDFIELESNSQTSNGDSYTPIIIEKWILYRTVSQSTSEKKGLASDSIIGFVSDNLNYLISDSVDKPTPESIKAMVSLQSNSKEKPKDTSKDNSKDTSKDTSQPQFIRMYYRPHDINKAIHSNSKPLKDDRSLNIVKSLYEIYIYQILLIGLVDVLNKSKNNKIRQKIVYYITNYTLKQNFNTELYELLKDYKTDWNIIKKLFSMIKTGSDAKVSSSSMEHYLQKEYISKKDLIEVIDNSLFEFDKFDITIFTRLDKKKLVSELTDMFKKLTIDADIDYEKYDEDQFPNVLTNCSANTPTTKNKVVNDSTTQIPYCVKDKIRIKKEKLDVLIDIMASDILNPLKSSILNHIYFNNILDNFKFIIRKDENIMISI